MARRRIYRIQLLALLAIALVVGGFTAAAAKAPKWAISFTGAIKGTAKDVKPECVYSPSGQSALAARATFKVGDRRLEMSIYFAPPLEPGSRVFGSSAGPSTVLVEVSETSDPGNSWLSGADGAGAINQNRRSGSVQGTVTAMNGATTEINASFECRKLSTGRSGSGSADQSSSDQTSLDLWEGPLRSEWNGSVCTGSTEGTMVVLVTGKKAIGTAIAVGSSVCPAIGSAHSDSLIFDVVGKFTGREFRFRIERIIGTGDFTSGCTGGPERPIAVPVTRRGTAQTSFEWAVGPEQYACDITLTR